MTHDKPTGGRTEAAAVDQAIADVRAGLDKGCTCGKTNHDLRGFDIDAYHDENDCRLCAALAALRVLADAVEELRADAAPLWESVKNSERRAVAAEAENVRLARQVADLGQLLVEAESLMRAFDKRLAHWHDLVDEWRPQVRAALAAARSRDPQEPQT